MFKKRFNSVLELFAMFPDEQSCIDYLEDTRWGDEVVSPFDPDSKVYRCKDNRYRCKNTGKYFNVRTGTLFDNTKVPLRSWFYAIYLVTNHRKGISSLQLSRDLQVTQKTAWFMLQRIRNCFDVEIEEQLDGVIELDETFVGGKNKNRHWDKKVKNSQGRSFKDKTPVFGMLQRGGRVIAKVVTDTTIRSLRPHILAYIKQGSTIYTDEWNYGNLNKRYNHDFINHKEKIYGNGEVYTNTIEGFWSIFKRGIMGIYHFVSKRHLQKYVDEFTFRYNTLKISQTERFDLFLQNMERRLKYENLTYS